jgi:hypothetical protein
MLTIGITVLALIGAALLLLAVKRPGRTPRPPRRSPRAPASIPARAPSMLRRISAGRRRREMEADVPEVLDVLRATIAAGVAPRRALQAAAEAAPPSLVGALA